MTNFNKYNREIEKYNRESAVCYNELLKQKRAFRCAICDNDFSNYFKQNKTVIVDDDTCIVVVKACLQAKVMESRSLYKLISDLVFMVGKTKNIRYKTKDFLPEDWLTTEDSLECNDSLDLHPAVGRSGSCIKMCQILMDEVITPKPLQINSKVFAALELIYSNFGNKEDLEVLSKYKGDNDDIDTLLKKDWIGYDWKSKYVAINGLNVQDLGYENGFEKLVLDVPEMKIENLGSATSGLEVTSMFVVVGLLAGFLMVEILKLGE